MTNRQHARRGATYLAALALALITLQANADGQPPPMARDAAMEPGHMHGPAVLRHSAELGLSSEQVDTINGIYRSAHPAMEQIHTQLHAQMQTLGQTRPTDPAYSNVVAKAAQTIGDLTSQSIIQESEVRTQVWNVLTAAQRDKLAAIEATAHEHGPGMPPPPGMN